MKVEFSGCSGLRGVVAVLIAVLFLPGCTPTNPITDRGGGQDDSEEIPVRTISLEQMRFSSPELAAKLRCFDATANRFAEDDWHRRPYTTFPSYRARGVYFAEWATFPNERGRNPVNYHGPKELHCISIGAVFDADAVTTSRQSLLPRPEHGSGAVSLTAPPAEESLLPNPEIVGVRLNARWKPAGEGWAATLRYRTFQGGDYPRSGKPDEDFRISFLRYPPPDSDGLLNFAETRIEYSRTGGAWYTADRIFGGSNGQPPTMYEFVVNTTDAHDEARLPREVPDQDVRRMMATPEALRDFGLAAYTALAKKIDEDIPSGKALRRMQLARNLHHGESPDALHSDRPLSPEELDEVHQTARAAIDLKIRLLREDYQEMHAALLRAFPLLECVPEPELKSEPE